MDAGMRVVVDLLEMKMIFDLGSCSRYLSDSGPAIVS
jgi:hypothetical protein